MENNFIDLTVNWDLDIKHQSWVEDTENQVDFIIKTLGLSGGERILDLACGFGRHCLSFARRGYTAVGVDITPVYIEDAVQEAEKGGLTQNTTFILSDIRDVSFSEEFDVVLNLADGAIGYLENDRENLKIFDVIAAALKPGGKHFMDICNAEHAETFFPKRHWDIGATTLSLPEFDWDQENRRMLFRDWEIRFGEVAKKPGPLGTSSARLYSKAEVAEIWKERNMEIQSAYSNYYGKEETPKELQLMVYSKKLG